MTTTVNEFRIPICLSDPYTGTQDEPDSVSLFYKQENGDIQFANEGIKNALGHSPLLGIPSAFPRIDKAVRQIFKECQLGAFREDSDLLNAIKNLIRGVAQLVPLLGNATLYVFDYVRTNLYFHSQIKTALAQQNGPIMGIAFDGKIVGQFSQVEMEAAFTVKDKIPVEDHLAVLSYSWFSCLWHASKVDAETTRLQLAQNLVRQIKTKTLL
jgi:hypothetical protein